ncbi:MAG: putative blue pigment (indigoidine) exporter, partial [Actinomycetota bacterium]|nr:putative blue pigment (indigoidine) exporter [Actinomycetota bacterium]
MSQSRGSATAYFAVLTPIIFGTTYLLTTQFLPAGRPLLAATMRSLPTGIVLIMGGLIPPPGWRLRFLALSVLYCSLFFPLH